MDKLLLVSLTGFFTSAALLLLISKSLTPTEIPLPEISENDVGRLAIVRGQVQSASYFNGNYLLLVCKRKCIRISIFQNMVEKMSAYSLDPSKIKPGNYISAEGTVDENENGLYLSLLDYAALQVEKK